MTLRTCPLCGAPRSFPIAKCVWCKKPFELTRADKVCCSQECASKRSGHRNYIENVKPRRQAEAAARRKAKRK